MIKQELHCYNVGKEDVEAAVKIVGKNWMAAGEEFCFICAGWGGLYPLGWASLCKAIPDLKEADPDEFIYLYY